MTSKSCQRRETKLPVLNTEFLKQQRMNFFVEVLGYNQLNFKGYAGSCAHSLHF